MKLLWLSTSSMQLEPIIKSLDYSMTKLLFTSVSSMNLEPIVCGLEKAIKPKIDFELYKFDDGKEAQYHYSGEVDHNILRKVQQYKPDVVIYSGPAEGNCLPMNSTFEEIRKNAKTVCLVCDGGCPNWHPLLDVYKRENIFDLVINIDGNHDWPKRSNDLTFWGLIDPSYYAKASKKDIDLGFAGGNGSKHRRDALEKLKRYGLVVPARSEQWGTYQEYADFMLRCRMVVNFPETGSGKAMHLKYRIIESGLAKCCVFEKSNPVTKRYFTPGEDYVEYEDLDDLEEKIKKALTNPDDVENKAIALKVKVERKYLPVRAWQEVFNSLKMTI